MIFGYFGRLLFSDKKAAASLPVPAAGYHKTFFVPDVATYYAVSAVGDRFEVDSVDSVYQAESVISAYQVAAVPVIQVSSSASAYEVMPHDDMAVVPVISGGSQVPAFVSHYDVSAGVTSAGVPSVPRSYQVYK